MWMRQFPLLGFLLCILALFATPAQAAVYSDYERYDEYILWVIHNYWEVWLVVDTDKVSLTLGWNAEDWFYSPLGDGYYFGSYIHVWDDNGNKIYWLDMGLTLAHIPPDGQMTFTYTNTYTWVHAEVRWSYCMSWSYSKYVTLRCDVYVGDGGSSAYRRGGGGTCYLC